MKKTHTLIPIGILTLAITTSFVSAYNGMGATNSEGDLLPIVLTLADVNVRANLYNNEKNSDDKETLNASGTANTNNDDKDENRGNASSSINKEKDVDFDLDGDTERSKDNRGLLISNMAQVHSGQDLRSYVQSLVHENKDIKGISMKEDRVSITRDMPTKLLGFILVPTKETIEVVSLGDGTKKVNIDRPWWNIFSKNEIAQKAISDELEIRIKDIPASDWNTTLSVATKAFIISKIQAVLLGNAYSTSTVNVYR